MKKILNSKVYDIISSIVEWIVTILLIVLIALMGFQKFSSRGNLFGYRIYTIASGSMIPTYSVGDTLLIKEMNADNIKVGDAVTYIGEGPTVHGMIITHQVIDIEFDDEGRYMFHTKGIANNIEDPIVYQEQVLGKVVHKFFILSIIGRITTSMPLLFIFITIPAAILIAIEIIKIVYKKDDDEIDKIVESEEKEEKEETKEKPEEEQEEVPEETEVSEEKEDTSLEEEIEESEEEEVEETTEESEEVEEAKEEENDEVKEDEDVIKVIDDTSGVVEEAPKKEKKKKAKKD